MYRGVNPFCGTRRWWNQSAFPHLSLRVKAEADLRLGVDVRSSFHQDLHNLQLTRQRGDVKRCVSLLQSQNMLFTSGPSSEGGDGQTEATRVQQIRDNSYVVQQLSLCWFME